MDPSQDTHLARLLHQQGRLPLSTLLSLLEEALARAEGRRERPALAIRSVKITRQLLAGHDPRLALREALAR